MFERLMLKGAALARSMAQRRRSALAEALGEAAPDGVRVSEENEDTIVLEGRGLERRYWLEPELRWPDPGRRR